MQELIYLISVIILTLFPGIELRGSIPLALLVYKMDPFFIIPLILAINILIIPITFPILDFVWKHISKKKIVKWYVEKIRKRAEKKVEKYGIIGLLFFVAIPLPGTGAYTGVLLAWLFKIDRKKAFIAITLGVLIAGAIISAVCLGALEALNWMI